MNAKRTGLAVVLTLMLVMVLSTPAFADTGLRNVPKRAIETQFTYEPFPGTYAEVYRQHLGIIYDDMDKNGSFKGLPAPIPVIPPLFDDEDVYQMHLRIFDEMEKKGATKGFPSSLPLIPPFFNDEDVYQMHLQIIRELTGQ